MRAWNAEVESVVRRLLAGSPLAEVADARGGSPGRSAPDFSGSNWYEGVDAERRAAPPWTRWSNLGLLIEVVDDLGLVARRALRKQDAAGGKIHLVMTTLPTERLSSARGARRPCAVRRDERRPRGDALLPARPDRAAQRRLGGPDPSQARRERLRAVGPRGPGVAPFVGFVGLARRPVRLALQARPSRSAGGWTRPRGQGYAPEAARAALDYAFESPISTTSLHDGPGKPAVAARHAQDRPHPRPGRRLRPSRLLHWARRRHVLYRLRAETGLSLPDEE